MSCRPLLAALGKTSANFQEWISLKSVLVHQLNEIKKTKQNTLILSTSHIYFHTTAGSPAVSVVFKNDCLLHRMFLLGCFFSTQLVQCESAPTAEFFPATVATCLLWGPSGLHSD